MFIKFQSKHLKASEEFNNFGNVGLLMYVCNYVNKCKYVNYGNSPLRWWGGGELARPFRLLGTSQRMTVESTNNKLIWFSGIAVNKLSSLCHFSFQQGVMLMRKWTSNFMLKKHQCLVLRVSGYVYVEGKPTTPVPSYLIFSCSYHL